MVEKAPPEGEVPAFDFYSQGVGIQAQRKGYLSLQFSQQNEGWTELSRLTIRSAESPLSSGSEQPVSQSPSACSGVIAEARAPFFLPIAAAALPFPSSTEFTILVALAAARAAARRRAAGTQRDDPHLRSAIAVYHGRISSARSPGAWRNAPQARQAVTRRSSRKVRP